MEPLFLNSGTMIPMHQSVGTMPVIKTKLNNFTTNSLTFNGLYFKNSFIILSTPKALLFYNFFSNGINSSSVNKQFISSFKEREISLGSQLSVFTKVSSDEIFDLNSGSDS